jgi:signal transduction histidine kinase
MVHELRTPLAALKASTTLLLRPDLPDNRRHDIIVTMQRETDRLTRMTTDFLDLARLESGRARLENAAFDVLGLIDESVEIVNQQASERNVTIHTPTEGGAAVELLGDRGKVKQVLLNLLTNAIKYNKENGEIYVTVSMPGDANARDAMVRLEVRDTGRGISDDNKQRMFEKFFRAADTAGYTQGTGLGLVIAKKIVEAHGGEMGFDSTLDVGTVFHFTLPVAAPGQPTAWPPSADNVPLS